MCIAKQKPRRASGKVGMVCDGVCLVSHETSDGGRGMAALVLEIPSRWWQRDRSATRAECLVELARLGKIFESGAAALAGLYLRMVDHVRVYQLQSDEVRRSLGDAGMSKERISEILRVAGAPEDVYREYSGKLIGFKVALEKTRLFRRVARSQSNYLRKKLARTARNLLKQAEAMRVVEHQFRWKGWVLLAVSELNITYIVRIFAFVSH